MSQKRLLSWSPAVLLALTSTVLAADWPQWRGPKRDNLSTETGLLKEWPADGPPLAWKATGLGRGFSSVSIANGKIYTMGDGPDGSEVQALSPTDGKKLWSAKVGKPGDPGGYPGTRCTPTVEGNLVFALGQYGDLVCLEASAGKEVWRKSLAKDFGGRMANWGYSESPLVDSDQVVCTPGGTKGTIVALNKQTGELIWQSKEFTDSAAYASLIIAEIAGVRQYVQLTDASVAGVAAGDGRLLWRSDRRGRTAVIPTPVFKDNHVFVTSGYGVGCNLFKITPADGAFKVEDVYANKDMENHHGGVLLIGGNLYGHSDRGGWTCMELWTGKVVWRHNGVGKGSLTYADGHLYLRSEGGKGTVALVAATPAGYQEKARFNQPDRSNQHSWPHPVIADGKLYLRDMDVLLCYDVKAK